MYLRPSVAGESSHGESSQGESLRPTAPLRPTLTTPTPLQVYYVPHVPRTLDTIIINNTVMCSQ